MEETKLTIKERHDIIDTLVFFYGKTEEYYHKCSDQQLVDEYNRRAKGGAE